MRSRLIDLCCILAIIFSLWASQDAKSFVDYLGQTRDGLVTIAKVFKIG